MFCLTQELIILQLVFPTLLGLRRNSGILNLPHYGFLIVSRGIKFNCFDQIRLN